MNAASFLRLVRKYTDIQELTPLVLHEMVEKIVVHHAQGTGKTGRSSLTSTTTLSAYWICQRLLLCRPA
ncbi:MAG: DUF4368 domain-containing protein [Hydrogeniiclostridium mannosilyticum]